MVWLKALPGYVYQSDIPGAPTVTSWGAEFDQATSDAILAEAAGWNRRNRSGQVLVVVSDPPIYTPGGSTGGGGGTSGDGVSQATFDAAIATLQGKATAATDTELSDAVATLNAALSGKQDLATAATDSEVAAAVATLNSAVALKQDASTAATDAELASAVATLNAALTAKQDASTAATDAEVAAGYQPLDLEGLLAARPGAASVPAKTIYWATDDNGGTLYRSNGATWAKMAPGATESVGQLIGQWRNTAQFATALTTPQDVPGWTGMGVTGWGGDVKMIFSCPFKSSVTTNRLVLVIQDDQAVPKQYVATNFAFSNANAGEWKTIIRSIPAADIPAGTTRTYKVQVYTAGAGTVTVDVAAVNEGLIRFERG